MWPWGDEEGDLEAKQAGIRNTVRLCRAYHEQAPRPAASTPPPHSLSQTEEQQEFWAAAKQRNQEFWSQLRVEQLQFLATLRQEHLQLRA